MKLSTWSNGKILSLTLLANDGTVKTIKNEFEKEVAKDKIAEIKEAIKPIDKEIDADNKKTSKPRVNKINKMFAEIEKKFFAKKAVTKKVKEKVTSETKTKKKEIVDAIIQNEQAGKVSEDKLKATDLTISITGTTNDELLANLEKEKQRLLGLQKNNSVQSASKVVHQKRGEY